jgi:hypothetical protein
MLPTEGRRLVTRTGTGMCTALATGTNFGKRMRGGLSLTTSVPPVHWLAPLVPPD